MSTPFAKHFDINKLFEILWRGRTSLSLAWEIAHAYLFSPTPENFKKFVHIEMLGKRCSFSEVLLIFLRFENFEISKKSSLINSVADLDAKFDSCMMNLQRNLNLAQKNGSNMCEPFWLFTVTVVLVTLSLIWVQEQNTTCTTKMVTFI